MWPNGVGFHVLQLQLEEKLENKPTTKRVRQAPKKYSLKNKNRNVLFLTKYI